jgi:hypothetical protein
LIDVTEMELEERQKLMWSMPMYALRDILERLMRDRRPTETMARLDALTIYTLRK